MNEQGCNRMQNYRGLFCLAVPQPGQTGCVMSQKLVLSDVLYVFFSYSILCSIQLFDVCCMTRTSWSPNSVLPLCLDLLV